MPPRSEITEADPSSLQFALSHLGAVDGLTYVHTGFCLLWAAPPFMSLLQVTC